MAQEIRPHLVDEPGVWFGIATGLLVVTFLVAAAAHLGQTDTALAAIIVGGLAAVRLPQLVVPAIGVIGWAFYTGFTENAFGQLTFAAADLARLIGFVAATVVLAYGVRQAIAETEGSRG